MKTVNISFDMKKKPKRRGLDFFKCSTNEEMLQIMGLVETA